MRKIQLLDCTLRDGGYVNDWEFGHNYLINIYERLLESETDIIELGFLDDRRPFDINRSIMPNTECMQKIYGHIKNNHAMLVGMIDYGTCDIKNIQPCEESCLDGIRVIFKKHIMHEAMAFCAEVKKKGYKVFSQLVSITSYSDEELMEVIKLANEVEPYAISIVDTYGLLQPRDLLHYYDLLDKYVDEKIGIGFHAHNNLQLAYANVLAFMEKTTKHDIVVDGTIYGMGKSAGNAPIELLMMELNQTYGKDYNINAILEATEESIMDFYTRSPWGYKTFFYLSALNKCHPNYVSFYQKKMNLSASKVNQVLERIEPEEKKLLYDKNVAESNYNQFVCDNFKEPENYKKLTEKIAGRNVLIIGPGKNILLQRESVIEYILETSPFIISVNFIPENYNVDAVFSTKGSRWMQMSDVLYQEKNQNVEVIATSNIEPKEKKFTYVFDRTPLLEKNEKIIDNSFLMLLNILKNCNIENVACAGLDGYSDKEDNYINPRMEYAFTKSEAGYLNNYIKEALLKFNEKMKIEFITYSHYTEIEDCHSATF